MKYKPTKEQQIVLGTGVPSSKRKAKYRRRAAIAKLAMQAQAQKAKVAP